MKQNKNQPSEHMQLALELARRGIPHASPNPLVGCVIVKQHQVVGRGFHQKYGGSHAEANALLEAGEAAIGADLYVNLEPCCHHGKTPPCTNALIAAGIKRVFIACVDPNPLVAGKGIVQLRAAGLEVHVGMEQAAAEHLNRAFFHFITHQKPFVTAKWAMSLDGKTIAGFDDSRQISNAESHAKAHALRAECGAILVGSKTACSDNPLLTVRLTETTPNKQPLRIILTSRGQIPFNLNVFNPHQAGETLIITGKKTDPYWYHLADEKKINVVLVGDENGLLDLNEVLSLLGKRNIMHLLVEGGMTTLNHFFAKKLVNDIHVFLAPMFIGALPKNIPLNNLQCSPLKADYHFMATLTKESGHHV